jgi:hypothetical protein
MDPDRVQSLNADPGFQLNADPDPGLHKTMFWWFSFNGFGDITYEYIEIFYLFEVKEETTVHEFFFEKTW